MNNKVCMRLGEKEPFKKADSPVIKNSLKIAEELLRDGMPIKEASAITELSEGVLRKIVKEKNIVVRIENFTKS